MELTISELDEYYSNESFSSYEPIPENQVNIPIKVIKKSVQFSEPEQKPTHQSIPKVNAKMVRPYIPPPKPSISYEDILSKMGMFVLDGKLHLIDKKNTLPLENQEGSKKLYQPQINNTSNIIPDQNSYIYNKYFKDEIKPEHVIRKPKTLQEYKRMVLEDYIKRQQIKQMKSKKLIMPTSNINISGGDPRNLNKLFSFSKK